MPFKTINRPRNITADGRKVLKVDALEGFNRLEVRAEADGQHIYMSGVVGGTWYDDSGIKEDEFRNALNAIPVGTKAKLHVNSEGGSVQVGLGIYNAIKERSTDLTAQVDGYACSIASVFPLAASKVVSPKSAIWMIHKASCGAYGNEDDMDQARAMLKEHDAMLVDIYAEHTGKSKKDIAADMTAETWIRGSKAVDYGLADEGDDAEDCGNHTQRIPEAVLAMWKKIPPNIYNSLSAASGGQPKPKTTDKIMNKKLIVAFLIGHGIEASETETEEQLQAKLEKIPKAKTEPVAKPAQTEAAIELEAIRSERIQLKTERITGKIKAYVDAQKITNAEVAIFVSAALADEAGTFKVLDEKESVFAGGEPVGFNRIDVGIKDPAMNGYQGRPTEMVANMYKEAKTPIAKYDAFKESFPSLYADAVGKDRRSGVRNENTFAAGITTNFLIMGAITKLGPQVPALKAFSRDNSVDPFKPLATGIQKFNTTVQDGSDVQTNATDFRTGDATLTGPAITVAQYTKTMHITNAQLNSGVRMADLIEASAGSLASKIAQVVTTPITIANFGGQAPLTINSGAFGFSDAATLQGQLKKSRIKNLILDGEYIARISNTPGFFQQAGLVGGLENAWKAFGWDILALLTEWQAADPFVRGFACNPQAIGILAGLPLNPPDGIPGNVVQIGSVMLPGPDIAIATYIWFDPNARTLYASYDLMLGAVAVDTTAGIIIKSQ